MKSFSFSARQSTFVEGFDSSRITRLTKASELSKSRTTGRLYEIKRVSMTGILSGLGCVLAPDAMGFGVDFRSVVGCVPRDEYVSSGELSPNSRRIAIPKVQLYRS